MSRIDDWLESKYTGDTPGPDRHERRGGEYHASGIGKCLRQNYYKFTEEGTDDWSPYFELGNQFELTYGAALAWHYGTFSQRQLKKLTNEQLITLCPRVVQDVTCNIHLGEDKMITGEADWCVLEPGAGNVSHIELYEDGSRRIDYADGAYEIIDETEYTPVQLVIETKTTRKIEWRKKYGYKHEHKYQVGTYMLAFEADGEIAYMTRNELDEMIFEFDYEEERDDSFFEDVKLRAQILDHKLGNDELPEADPPRDNICKYCDWKDECKEAGGKRWD